MSGAPAEVGSTANSYQILARLAAGGMAEIFLARGVSEASVERYCVLKRILRDRATDLHFVRMFLDEARLAAQLNHPNVAQVYDIGKLGDSYFFTMEYVHGETVRAVMQRARSLRRELPIGAILTIAAGAAAGLHHAHERLGAGGKPLGIVHRDVSPSNLMVSFEGGVKLVDFGVAKAAGRLQETRSGTVKGKISYLSPEQCRGNEVDRRTDLFALGIVMWEMLTGERLYRRSSDFENMNAIVNEPVVPPSARRPAIAPALDAIVMRLLAKAPADRFQSGDELVEALEAAASASGAMLSTASLGRLLREMFGQRPEPWLELDAAEAPENITVTSQPVPAELGGVPMLDSVDVQLSEVPDLAGGIPAPAQTRPGTRAAQTASERGDSAPIALPPPPDTSSPPPGARAPGVPSPIASSPSPGARAAPGPSASASPGARAASPPAGSPVVPSPPVVPSEVPSPAIAARDRSSPHASFRARIATATASLDGAGFPALAPPTAPAVPAEPVPPPAAPPPPLTALPLASLRAGGGTGDLPLPAPPPTIPELPPNRTHPVSPASSSPLPPIRGSAISLSGRSARTPGSDRHALPVSLAGSGRVPLATTPPAPSSPAPVPGQLAAGPPVELADPVLAEPRPRRRWAMIAVVGAAAVVGSFTVWFVMSSGAGAAAGTGTAAPVERMVAQPAAPSPSPAAPVVTPIVDAPAATAPTPLERALDERRFADAVALCPSPPPAELAERCTIAACGAHADAKARAWLARVPAAARTAAVAACRSHGVDVAAAPRRPLPRPAGSSAGSGSGSAALTDAELCEREPLRCQH